MLAVLLAGCEVALPKDTVGVFKTDPTATASVKVNGPDVEVTIVPVNFKVVPTDSADRHKFGEGHFHLFLDVAPTPPGEVIPKTAGVYHTTDTNYTIHDVTNGHHALYVVLGFTDHTPYENHEVVKSVPKGSIGKVEFDVTGGAAQPAPTPSAEASPTAAPSPVAEASPSPAQSSAPPPPGGTKVALLADATNGGKFDPANLSIKVGDTVEWEWQDADASHTVTDDGGAGGFDSGTQSSGFKYTHKYDAAGSFAYHCSLHPNMTGTITVQ
jgi:plastocyanin